MTEEIELQPDKLKSLQSTLDELDLDLPELFSDEFVRNHSSFSSIDEMFQSEGWSFQDGTLDYEITVGDADELASAKTDFSTWHQFMNAALDKYWNSSEQNRRRHERFSCSMKVSIETGTDVIPGTITNLSKKGFQIQTSEQIPNTRTVKVKLSEEESSLGGAMVFRGAVRWKNEETPPYSMGFEILSKSRK